MNLSSYEETAVSTVDLEQAEELSKALYYLSDLELKWRGQVLGDRSERQVFYKTGNGLSVGFRQAGTGSFVSSSARIGDVNPIEIDLTWRDPDPLAVLKEKTQNPLERPSSFVAMKAVVDKGIAWLKQQ
jgi:hypothetical protein